MKKLIGVAVALTLVVAAAALALVRPASAGGDELAAARAATARYHHELAAARAATARFHSVEHALAAGYVQGSPCEQLPGVGGMGIHYVNPALIGDPAIDPRRPEILLYAPKEHGKLELVGVEYFKVDADQNLATDGDRPSVFGRPFDGPMLGHAPGMPIHYDLHVWFWRDNPNGLFSVWNPTVTCPAP
jgi:hypothetical protein